MKYILITIAFLGIFLFGGCVSPSAYETLQKENESLKAENGQLKLDNSDLTKELELYKDTFGEVYENVQPPYKGAEPMELKNNPDAINPTWAELVAFLERDETEKIRYYDLEADTVSLPEKAKGLGISDGETPKYFVCVDFANLLHDNAESNGIRAAVVAIQITGEDYAHVFNAFLTTDKGLVFIDDTGDEDCKGVDKVAYVEFGKEIGSVKLNDDTLLDYEWFEEQKALLESYNLEIGIYNMGVRAGELGYEAGRISYVEFMYDTEYSEKESLRLNELREQLVPIFGLEGGGIVTNVEIYW